MFVVRERLYAHPVQWDSVVDVVTRLGSGRSEVGIPAGAKDFSFLYNFQTDFGTYSPLYLMRTEVFTRG